MDSLKVDLLDLWVVKRVVMMVHQLVGYWGVMMAELMGTLWVGSTADTLGMQMAVSKVY